MIVNHCLDCNKVIKSPLFYPPPSNNRMVRFTNESMIHLGRRPLRHQQLPRLEQPANLVETARCLRMPLITHLFSSKDVHHSPDPSR